MIFDIQNFNDKIKKEENIDVAFKKISSFLNKNNVFFLVKKVKIQNISNIIFFLKYFNQVYSFCLFCRNGLISISDPSLFTNTKIKINKDTFYFLQFEKISNE